MPTQDHATLINQARQLLAQAIAASDIPQIEAMLRNADMELHFALWCMGQAVSLRPELEYRADGAAFNAAAAASPAPP